MSGRNAEWFALRVRSRHEQAVVAALEHRGIENFLPMYRERRRWSDRYQTIEVPLFPGYVFSRFDLYDRMPVLSVPGLVGIVGIGRVPHPVDAREVADLQVAARSGRYVQPWPFLSAGARVLVEEGPLRGVEGTIVVEKGLDRLVLSITLLQRAVAVTIERAWVRPLADARITPTCAPQAPRLAPAV